MMAILRMPDDERIAMGAQARERIARSEVGRASDLERRAAALRGRDPVQAAELEARAQRLRDRGVVRAHAESDYRASVPGAEVRITNLKTGVSANAKANELLTPFYLKRLAMLAQKENDVEAALKYYQQLKDEYPNSTEGQDAEKYLIYLEGK
jgi:Tfp pilus assembly protein PilF